MDSAHFYVYSTFLICLCYSYFISLTTQKGFFRLLFLLPAICLLPILPLYLPHIVSSVMPATYLLWLSTSRLILFTFGKGPLKSAQSLYSFIIFTALPLRTPSSKIPLKLAKLSKFGLEIISIAVLAGSIEQYKQALHPKILTPFYTCLTFLSSDCLVAVLLYIRPKFMGIDLEPMFHEPYLSTSLQDFWGKRWNLTVSDQFRDMVYIPVNSVWGPIPASLATFLASGLMHELLYYYATRAPPSWEMTSFFVLHGIALVLEVCVKKAFKGRLNLPPIVSTPLTVGFLLLTGLWLYFPPLVKSGFFDMVFEDLRSLGQFAHNGMALLV